MEIAAFVVAVLAVLVAGVPQLSAQALAVQRAALPPEWSAIEQLGENTVGFRNQSSRAIVVTGITTEPDEAAQFITATPRPHTVEYGDLLAVQLNPRLMLVQPHRLTIVWHFADDPDEAEHSTNRQM